MLHVLGMLWFQTEGTADQPSGTELLLPATPELIAGILAFLIILVFVWKWGFPAMDRALAMRQEAITSRITAAEQSKAEAESLLADYRQQYSDARGEANKIVDDAKHAAESVRAEIIARAEQEATEIRRKAREDADAEKDRAAAQIKDEVASLSLALAQKVVDGSVDADTQRTLVERYIDELGSLS